MTGRKSNDAKADALSVVEFRRNYERQLSKAAKQFRKNVLIPFCDLYGVVFIRGNGGFSLFLKTPTEHGEDLEDRDVQLASKIPMSEIRKILRALLTRIIPFESELVRGGVGLFGYEVESYDTRNKEKPHGK